MKIRAIQFAISFGALLIAIAHVIWPNVSIDAITLMLLIVAIVPWLAPLFKSLELPGGWKIEFQDLQRTRDKADRAGLLATTVKVEDTPRFSFQLVATEDPNLALAGLRIEIERRLVQLAETRGLNIRKPSVGKLLSFLSQKQILTQEESAVLADMVSLLNSAVHGAQVDNRAADWAIDVGPRLLRSLDEKIGDE